MAALVQLNRAILAEATISFLGLGIQPPEATWGNLLIGAQDYLYTAPWLAIAPGLAITLTLLAVYSIGIGRAVGPRAEAGRAGADCRASQASGSRRTAPVLAEVTRAR